MVPDPLPLPPLPPPFAAAAVVELTGFPMALVVGMAMAEQLLVDRNCFALTPGGANFNLVLFPPSPQLITVEMELFFYGSELLLTVYISL